MGPWFGEGTFLPANVRGSTRISFRVFRIFGGYLPQAVAWGAVIASLEIFESMHAGLPNQITGANAGKPQRFAVKSRVSLSPWPGVAQFHR